MGHKGSEKDTEKNNIISEYPFIAIFVALTFGGLCGTSIGPLINKFSNKENKNQLEEKEVSNNPNKEFHNAEEEVEITLSNEEDNKPINTEKYNKTHNEE